MRGGVAFWRSVRWQEIKKFFGGVLQRKVIIASSVLLTVILAGIGLVTLPASLRAQGFKDNCKSVISEVGGILDQMPSSSSETARMMSSDDYSVDNKQVSMGEAAGAAINLLENLASESNGLEGLAKDFAPQVKPQITEVTDALREAKVTLEASYKSDAWYEWRDLESSVREAEADYLASKGTYDEPFRQLTWMFGKNLASDALRKLFPPMTSGLVLGKITKAKLVSEEIASLCK